MTQITTCSITGCEIGLVFFRKGGAFGWTTDGYPDNRLKSPPASEGGRILQRLRARKRNGSLHMLCQEHRLKANKTQRDMQRRLREQRRQQQLNNQLWSPVTMQRVDRVLLQDMPELDTDDDLDWWATAEPLDGPVELRPEDIEALLELWDTTMRVV
ncbi:hypothetical protein BBJ28_00014024 [Nothophytophthora sp. Chile5]|nr:hypothetical protein BBJ28_00014024 [Nothophytophthora sp. Chile5]